MSASLRSLSLKAATTEVVAVSRANREAAESVVQSDLELVAQVKAGNRKAFAELVRRHQRGLLRIILRLTRELPLAEDVVQETFIKAYEKMGGRASRAGCTRAASIRRRIGFGLGHKKSSRQMFFREASLRVLRQVS